MKKVLIISKMQFETWISDRRMIALIVLVFFVDRQVTSGLCENAAVLGEKLCILEPFIATAGSMWLQIVIPVIYIVLMYDYPSRYGSKIFYIIRSGRDKWYYGQMVFAAVGAFVYTVVLFFITVVLNLKYVELKNSWSVPVTMAYSVAGVENNAAANLIKPSTFFQGTPLMVFSYNFVFLFFNLLLVNMLQLTLFSWNIRKYTSLLCIGLETVGAVTAFITKWLRWAFPTANAVFSLHFENYISAPKYPVICSILYFMGSVLLLWITGLIGISHAKLADRMEDS